MGGLIWRGQGGLLVLLEEVEAQAVLPLGTGHTDLVLYNPGPPVSVVGGPD